MVMTRRYKDMAATCLFLLVNTKLSKINFLLFMLGFCSSFSSEWRLPLIFFLGDVLANFVIIFFCVTLYSNFFFVFFVYFVLLHMLLSVKQEISSFLKVKSSIL